MNTLAFLIILLNGGAAVYTFPSMDDCTKGKAVFEQVLDKNFGHGKYAAQCFFRLNPPDKAM